MPTPSFPTSLWFTIQHQEVGMKTLISSGDGGTERRRLKVSTARLRFSCPLNQLSSSDLSTFYSFYTARHGSYEAFNITVNGTTYLVRFEKDGLTWEWFHQNWYRSSISVIEVTA